MNKNDLFMDPYLYPQEKLLLYKYLDNSSIYFEFGFGGTTHQAAKRNLKIYSVEPSQSWASQLQRDFEKIKKNIKNFDVDITYLVSDIITENNTENYIKYVKMYNHSKYGADFILIDGKYLLACLMNVYQEIDNKTIVFLHQLENRDLSSIFKKYFDIIGHERDSYVLKKKNDQPQLSNEILSGYENQDFTFKNNLISTMDYMKKNFNDLIEKYKNIDDSESIKPDNNQVWIFWWQRIENAPEIVKICYQSVLRNFKNGKITIITQDNYKNYTNIPQIIIDKLNAGRFSLTHFSDIVRESVLSTRGGLWLDATIFLAREIPSDYFNNPYYTIHGDDSFFITFGKWCIFTQSSYINGIVTRFCCDFFYIYWSKFNDLINYFLTDYVMLFGYEYVPGFRKSVQQVPVMNERFFKLVDALNKKYTPESFKNILNSGTFYKLTYKSNFHSQIDGSNLTNYGYLIEKFIKNV